MNKSSYLLNLSFTKELTNDISAEDPNLVVASFITLPISLILSGLIVSNTSSKTLDISSSLSSSGRYFDRHSISLFKLST